MIGVFDSGRGGLLAVREMRKMSSKVDICFFADKENSPYGTKTRDELIKLVRKDIEVLERAGATKVLMACCTASTVYEYLPKRMREVACPIILPTARRAMEVSSGGNIAVIATRATVISRAFTKALSGYGGSVYEFEAQELVSLVESGCTDVSITESEIGIIEKILAPVKEKEIETLILGCTHFPHLQETVSKILPRVKIVSSALEGAREILKNEEKNGEGKTLFL